MLGAGELEYRLTTFGNEIRRTIRTIIIIMSIEPNFKIKLYACIMSENEVGGGGGGQVW